MNYPPLRCNRCGASTPHPPYGLSAANRARRLCADCRRSTARENGKARAKALAAIAVGPEARQVILGSVLGDGALEAPPKGQGGEWGLAIKHAKAQEPYLRWKAAKLGSLVRRVDTPEGRVRVRTVRHPVFTALAGERESVSDSFLAELGPLALAVWFYDDGNTTPPRVRPNGQQDKLAVRLSACAFSLPEIDRLRQAIHRLVGAETTVCSWRNPRDPSAPYRGIRLYAENAEAFLRYVSQVGEVPGVSYKVDTLNSGVTLRGVGMVPPERHLPCTP